MKSIIWVLSLASVMAGMIFTGCNNREDRWDDKMRRNKRTNDKVYENKDLDNTRTVYHTEWDTWRDDALDKIEKNEDRINELKAKMDKAGPKRDEKLAKRIGELREENRELRQRIYDYKYIDDRGWQDFKREFKHDMDRLGDALNDIGKDNVKDTK